MVCVVAVLEGGQVKQGQMTNNLSGVHGCPRRRDKWSKDEQQIIYPWGPTNNSRTAMLKKNGSENQPPTVMTVIDPYNNSMYDYSDRI
jgi:hypothetical protein